MEVSFFTSQFHLSFTFITCTKTWPKINYPFMSVLLLLTWCFEYECSCLWTSISIPCFRKANLNSNFKSKEYNLNRNVILSKSEGKNIFRNSLHSHKQIVNEISLVCQDWRLVWFIASVKLQAEYNGTCGSRTASTRKIYLGEIWPIQIRSIVIMTIIIPRLRRSSW